MGRRGETTRIGDEANVQQYYSRSVIYLEGGEPGQGFIQDFSSEGGNHSMRQ